MARTGQTLAGTLEAGPSAKPRGIVPVAPETRPDYPAVIAVQGADAREEGRRVGELLRFLRCSGVIACYGQAALLLHIVKDGVSGPYVDGLETAGEPARCEPARCEPVGHVANPSAMFVCVRATRCW